MIMNEKTTTPNYYTEDYWRAFFYRTGDNPVKLLFNLSLLETRYTDEEDSYQVPLLAYHTAKSMGLKNIISKLGRLRYERPFVTGGIVSGVDFGSGKDYTTSNTVFLVNLYNMDSIPLPPNSVTTAHTSVFEANLRNIEKFIPMPVRRAKQGTHHSDPIQEDVLKRVTEILNSITEVNVQRVNDEITLTVKTRKGEEKNV
jgi:hypothetical protein